MHAAILDLDSPGSGTLYSPFLNSPYNSQTGFLQTANQIYPNQVGRQYYVPELTNQNQAGLGLAPAGSNLNPQWPQGSFGSSVYQNSYPYQQQNIYPVNPGYGPVVQSPVQLPVQTVQQPAKQIPNPVFAYTNQYQGKQASVRPVPTTTLAPVKTGLEGIPQQSSSEMDKLTNQIYKGVSNTNQVDGSNFRPDQSSKDYQLHKSVQLDNKPAYKNDHAPEQTSIKGDNENSAGRHSEEVYDSIDDQTGERTYPPSTKPRTQVYYPTQSTVAGQKPSHSSSSSSHSEGFQDYSWMDLNYNDRSQKVGGKKGIHSKTSDQMSSNPVKQTPKPDTNKLSASEKQQDFKHISKVGSDLETSYPSDRDGSRLRPVDYNTDDYRFDDYRRPSSNRRPYGRYDNSRQWPSYRYPYYARGKGRLQNDYYYPDTYDDKPYGDYGSLNTGEQGVVCALCC